MTAKTTIRDKRATVRFNQAERQALQAIARQERRTDSEMLRELVRREARAMGVWPIQRAA